MLGPKSSLSFRKRALLGYTLYLAVTWLKHFNLELCRPEVFVWFDFEGGKITFSRVKNVRIS